MGRKFYKSPKQGASSTNLLSSPNLIKYLHIAIQANFSDE